MMFGLTHRTQIKIKRWLSLALIAIGVGIWVYILCTDEQEKITKIEIQFADSFQVYSKDYILQILKKEVNEMKNETFFVQHIDSVEQKLRRHTWIEKANVYVLHQALILHLTFKRPSIKVLATNQQMYYVNQNGEALALPEQTQIQLPLAIHVPIIPHDSINQIFLKNLAVLGNYFSEDTIWKQKSFYVDFENPESIRLYTYQPTFTFILGDIENYKRKLDKALFFQRYATQHQLHFSAINVQYKNQIIGINN